MFELKTLSKEAVPRALEKAERYRLLNEPNEAESICLDVLRVAPDNQQALVVLLLALTDQFEHGTTAGEARQVLPRLHEEYDRLYYEGLICERQAKAQLRRGGPGARFAAYEWFREAMSWYERAEAVRLAGNDDAALRWNACARALMQNRELEPAPREGPEPPLE